MSSILEDMLKNRGRKKSSWFETTFGFEEYKEGNAMQKVRDQFEFDASSNTMKSKANGREFRVGEFTIPSLLELRARLNVLEGGKKRDEDLMSVASIAGDVRTLILDSANEGAVFQAASQFNTLEMINPNVSPEDGIENYIADRTQGPACAMACPSGTLFRNYFASFPEITGFTGLGQTSQRSIDTSKDTLEVFKRAINADKVAVMSKNGYLLPTSETSLAQLSQGLQSLEDPTREEVLEAARCSLRQGVMWSTETQAGHEVTQVYCSACPVSYDKVTNVNASKLLLGMDRPVPLRDLWRPLAIPVLESAYESTILVAGILALQAGTRKTLYLTKLGGGVFGNSDAWIVRAIEKATKMYSHLPLDVRVVHYGSAPETDRYSSLNKKAKEKK